MRSFVVLCFIFISSSSWAVEFSAPALRAIDSENWHIALEETKRNKQTSSYVKWRSYQDNKFEASFGELAKFIDKHPDWPRIERIQTRAEKILFQTNQKPDWLKHRAPISGYGMFALARVDPNSDLIRKGWINGDFERGDETQILAEFGSHINQSTHRARAERLLSQNKATIAGRLLDFVGRDHAKLYRARIAIQRKERSLSAKINSIPAKLASDHGLLADRAIWRHKKGVASGSRELLLNMKADSPYADALWRIRASYVRDAIEAGAYMQAASLLKNSGILSAGNQADSLWLKGWLDLTFRKNTKSAYQHFNQLYSSVKYPVSKARGAYWSAKAAQSLGDGESALKWFNNAAKYPTAFYGQLAHAELYPNKSLPLPASPSADSTAYRHYRDHDLMRLAISLHKAGMDKLSAPLLSQIIMKADDAGEFAALMKLCKSHKMLHGQVRVAKMALRHNIILREGWPLVSPPSGSPLPPELAFAISRQESEFNPVAVSRANARGLMQLLPSTARKTASTIGMNYSLSKLFDPQFNMRLGSQYLADLISGFDGNYILSIAGYNAGPGRSRQWVKRFGQPGKNLNQTLKFMELIPFSETRNYVQRVLENAQVYRELMRPNHPLQIKEDLLR